MHVRGLRGFLSIAVASALAGSASGSVAPAPGWGRAAKMNIIASEYRFSEHPDGGWTAPNRAHGFRSRVSPAGLYVTPRTDDSWEFRLQLVSFGRGNDLLAAPSPEISATGNRVVLSRELVDEWYVNDASGLEQGFSVPAAPAHGAGPLVLEMHVDGDLALEPAADGQSIDFTRDGLSHLRYAKLVVRDAAGAQIPAWFTADAGRLRIEVDDSDAVYPVEIDPLTTAPVWAATSGQFDAEFGNTVASAGDVNNDGYDDVIIGADEYDAGQTSEGRAFVFYGSATGLSTFPSWTAESNQTGADFGISVASAGDVNGDGYDDVIIGANLFDNVETSEGAVFVFYGSSTGLNKNGTRVSGTPGNADWWAESNVFFATFGTSVASAGDTNNDGYDDVIIGCDEYTSGHTGEGAAFVFRGSSTGLGLGGLRPVGNPMNADWSAEANRVDTDMGYSVSSAGDVNNDGYDDVLVGAWNWDEARLDEGRVFVFMGSSNGLSLTPARVYDGGQDNARLGIAVSAAGDVNGDGFDDIILGADLYDNPEFDEGAAFVFHGSPTGLSATPDWLADSNQDFSEFGFAVDGAGDLNNDGYDDVIVGAHLYDAGQDDEGAVFVYLGSADGLADTPNWAAESNQIGAQLGRSVAGAGDVNHDLYDDVIVGADEWDTAGAFDEGGAFVFAGCSDTDADGWCSSEDNCPTISNPDQTDSDTDDLGDVCDPCSDTDNDGACNGQLVLVDYDGPGEKVLVQFGTSMRYKSNSVDPGIGMAWTETVFDDSTWSTGAYGVGYDTVGEAVNLIATAVPAGAFSVYTRTTFNITDVPPCRTCSWARTTTTATSSGSTASRSSVPARCPVGTLFWNTNTTGGHEPSNLAQPDYTPLRNISFVGIPALGERDERDGGRHLELQRSGLERPARGAAPVDQSPADDFDALPDQHGRPRSGVGLDQCELRRLELAARQLRRGLRGTAPRCREPGRHDGARRSVVGLHPPAIQRGPIHGSQCALRRRLRRWRGGLAERSGDLPLAVDPGRTCGVEHERERPRIEQRGGAQFRNPHRRLGRRAAGARRRAEPAVRRRVEQQRRGGLPGSGRRPTLDGRWRVDRQLPAHLQSDAARHGPGRLGGRVRHGRRRGRSARRDGQLPALGQREPGQRRWRCVR